jgi:aspartyl/asparaginyl beta-hydroxylase (cupin superfamily)
MSVQVSIDQLASRARALAGNRDRAVEVWRQLLKQDPDHTEGLNAVANWHLAQGQSAAAATLLARAVQVDAGQAPLHFNLATAQGALGQFIEALRSLDAALAIDPYFVQALFHKAVLLEQIGQPADAATVYRNYLSCMPAEVHADPRMVPMVKRARAAIDADNRQLRKTLDETVGTAELSPKVAEAVGLLTGEAKLYIQQPTFLTVPHLPAIPYFDQTLFPWLADLEAASDDILGELQALFDHRGENEFEPYVARPEGAPINQWGELNHSRRWTAFHLWLNGKRQDQNCLLCPRTAALVEGLPRIVVPDRAPNAFFSVLRAGSHIPPHTGVTNMRATIHLGLIVPPNCAFRVGNEIRQWQAGKAWAFDDSIEHEAWNNSDKDRTILIVDGWNPYIEVSEREALIGLHSGYDRHYGRAPGWAGGG